MIITGKLSKSVIARYTGVIDFYLWKGITVARSWPKHPKTAPSPAMLAARAAWKDAWLFYRLRSSLLTDLWQRSGLPPGKMAATNIRQTLLNFRYRRPLFALPALFRVQFLVLEFTTLVIMELDYLSGVDIDMTATQPFILIDPTLPLAVDYCVPSFPDQTTVENHAPTIPCVPPYEPFKSFAIDTFQRFYLALLPGVVTNFSIILVGIKFGTEFIMVSPPILATELP